MRNAIFLSIELKNAPEFIGFPPCACAPSEAAARCRVSGSLARSPPRMAAAGGREGERDSDTGGGDIALPKKNARAGRDGPKNEGVTRS